MGAFGGQSSPVEDNFTLDFATPSLQEIVTNATKGQNGKSGLSVKAGFTVSGSGSDRYLGIKLEIENHSGVQVKDFDIMFNKNPFGIGIYGMSNQFNIPDPSSGKSSKVLKCTIDKKNLDAKNPPGHPFKI